MATYSKIALSGSTNGRQIKIGTTATPGTTLHTAHATSLDEVWLYVTNNHTAAVVLTIEHGGTTSPDDLIVQSIPAKEGLLLVLPGLVLTGSVVLKAFAGTTNVISAVGFVNRITP